MDTVGASPGKELSPSDKIRLLEAEIDRLEERNKQLKTAIRKALLNIIMLEIRLDIKTL